MRRRLLAALLGLVGLVVLVYTVPLARYLAEVERDRLVTALERDAFVLAGRAKELLDVTPNGALPELEPLVEGYSADHAEATVVITDWRGLLVASNDDGAAAGEDYGNRPEVASALDGTPASGERESRTLGTRLVYVAVPVLLGDDVVGVVRISHPRSAADDEVREQLSGILAVGAISLLVAAVVAWWLSGALIRPLRSLRTAAERVAAGDLAARAVEEGPPEVRDMGRSFNTMTARLGANLEHQRAFAGEVSHQLRTPLTALRLRLEQAENSVGTREEIDRTALVEALDASRAETDRLQTLVEQLLALARLEGGEMPTVVVDAAAVAASRTEMWGPLADEHGVTVAVEAGGRAECRAVEGALEQIVDNFVDNALSVAPRGSTVTVRVSRDGDDVLVEVVDAGPGLTADQRRDAFQRFWRGPAATPGDGGTGLGLAVVRQLALASGGSAELLEGPGGAGLRARVRFPAGRNPAPKN